MSFPFATDTSNKLSCVINDQWSLIHSSDTYSLRGLLEARHLLSLTIRLTIIEGSIKFVSGHWFTPIVCFLGPSRFPLRMGNKLNFSLVFFVCLSLGIQHFKKDRISLTWRIYNFDFISKFWLERYFAPLVRLGLRPSIVSDYRPASYGARNVRQIKRNHK